MNGQSHGRIMIVEDSTDFSELLRELLTSEGYSIDCAPNGLAALEFLRTGKVLPDLILLDLMMPVMNGFQFKEEQARIERLAHIPVVVMSAHRDVQVARVQIGAQDFLQKPPEIEQILSVVKRNVR